jgi:uncharacterized protein with ParB-like and HNH nuclease domain
MPTDFNINPTTIGMTWQTIFERVKLGYDIQEIESDSLSKQEIVKYNDAIVISPDYQREYRSSVSDESSLIESALIGIPIPPIFLASYRFKGTQVLNVVDGQHRLRAFYRFFANKFKLTDLRIESAKNGSYFDDLDLEDIMALQSRDISTITFRDFPGKAFELEIFNRYNKGTKPLTPQDIRHAVYDSKVNELVNDFCKELMEDPKSTLSKAYAISKDRYQKKACQENVFVILSILEDGVTQDSPDKNGKKKALYKSPQFAESYMAKKSTLEDEDPDSVVSALRDTTKLFNDFNTLVTELSSHVEYPFSKEIYGVSKRGNKFQVSISMILAGVFRKLSNLGVSLDGLCMDENITSFIRVLSESLNGSYLEDPDYNASTTNPVEIQKFVDAFEFRPKALVAN